MTYNDTQSFTRNRQLPGCAVGESREMKLADWGLVSKCQHRLDAIRLCVQLSGLSNAEVALRLLIDPGNFSRMMQGKSSFPDARSIKLMETCGNYAPLQFEAQACGFQLVDKRILKALGAQAA
jgi:hypothetical protein